MTGGVKGIGRAIVSRLLQANARVAIWDIDREGLAMAADQVEYPEAVLAVPCDLRDEASIRAAAAATEARFGNVSLLVNNAALVFPELPVLEVPPEQWTAMYDVNVVGAHRCCQTLIPQMIERGYGRVVNIASAAGKYGNERLSAYSASKAALINYTKVMGRELATTGILVNCVAPGATVTDGLAIVSKEQRDMIAGWIPMKRFADPIEIAALAIWLCSDECTFTTGATFDATGGRSYY